MNTIKDLLRDLVVDCYEDTEREQGVETLVEEYHTRFIKEISKYFELEGI